MTAQEIVDALEAGTLVIPADYREILQAIATVANSAEVGGGGWELTGTTTLTGNVVVDTDGNTLEFSGGEVGIGGAAVTGKALSVDGNLKCGVTTGLYGVGIGTDNTNGTTIIGDFAGIGNNTIITIDEINQKIIFMATNGIEASGAISAYADNTAAVSAIGTGKLYYTDVAGEYLIKLSH